MQLEIDGIPFLLKSPQAFTWLQMYGRVEKVYDRLTSGNICFVVDGPYGKLFIKYAGAEPINYGGQVRMAVKTLKNAVALYTPPRPNLTQLLAHGNAGEGYAAIFRFEEGEPPKITPDGQDVLARLLREPLVVRFSMLDSLFALIADLSLDGFVGVDISAANLLVNFLTGMVTMCDIDQFRIAPAVNNLGRMPGDANLLAPEEYEQGAVLDARTDVYHMGALAFLFLAGAQRETYRFDGSKALYQVAQTATHESRMRRYSTPDKMLRAWRHAVGETKIR